mmetsp:Transcript_71422/g.201493  ORF Transcript_71422/g.201493 Transcript_71422/m.201493 type:complete len:424 (+) Transcript_71422:770-2041(+)
MLAGSPVWRLPASIYTVLLVHPPPSPSSQHPCASTSSRFDRDEQAREYILDEFTHHRRKSLECLNQVKGLRAPSPVTVHGTNKFASERASRRSIQLNELPLHVVQTAETTMEGIDEWGFNVWSTKGLTSRPLKLVGLSIAVQYDLSKQLGIPDETLLACLSDIDDGYHNNLYHNSYHAADVMQSAHFMMSKINKPVELPWLMQAALLLAAAAHDIGHLGVNNHFLEASNHSLAIRYNNHSILENFHAATFFDLLKTESRNIFKNLSKDDFSWIRSVIIKLILATDMSVHGSKLSSFNAKVGDDHLNLTNEDDQVEMCCMMLHASDVSNCARPWDVYLKWVEPITEEFYRQGDSEAKAGLPVTPMMDRNNPIPTEKFQSGFINAIVLPLFKGLGEVPQLDLREPLLNISKNDAKWKQTILEKAS